MSKKKKGKREITSLPNGAIEEEDGAFVEARWAENVTFYREASTQVSANIRSLNLGGIAFAWAFKVAAVGGGWTISPAIALAILFFAIGLVLDTIQYIYTSAAIDEVLE